MITHLPDDVGLGESFSKVLGELLTEHPFCFEVPFLRGGQPFRDGVEVVSVSVDEDVSRVSLFSIGKGCFYGHLIVVGDVNV